VKLLFAALLVITMPVLAGGAVILLNRLPLAENPGIIARLKTYLTTNTAETSVDSPFPELAPRNYPLPPEKLYMLAEACVVQLGWTIAHSDRSRRELHTVAVTPVWKFRDDVRIRVDASTDRGSIVHLRSQSRVGRGDLGTNARHILDFYARLEQGLP